MDINAKYDLSELQDFFVSWYSPEELISIFRRIAMNMSVSYLENMDMANLYNLKDDLDDLRNFIFALEQVKRIDK